MVVDPVDVREKKYDLPCYYIRGGWMLSMPKKDWSLETLRRCVEKFYGKNVEVQEVGTEIWIPRLLPPTALGRGEVFPLKKLRRRNVAKPKSDSEDGN